MLKFDFFKENKVETFFSYIDIFFANNFDPKSEEEAIFLAYLFFISRNSFVSLFVENENIYPEPEEVLNDQMKDINYKILIEKVIEGSKKASCRNYIENTPKIFPICPIVKFENYYYLQKNFVFETYIIKNLKKLITAKPNDIFDKKDFFENLNHEQTLFIDQKQAIINAYNNSISFIIGDPGCGKTYLTSHLIKIFSLSFNIKKKNQFKIVATSFTGKATSHLKKIISENFDNINFEVKTLHLLLDIKEGKNKYFEKNKIDFDLIVVDEASMIDIRLFSFLLDSIKEGARIIFIGDINQLPPIDGGNVFYDVINQNIVTTTYLKKAVRFENNFILELANFIKENKSKNFIELLENNNFSSFDHPNIVKEIVFEKAKEYFYHSSNRKLNVEEILEKTKKFRILSSIKKGSFGVEVLNKEIFSFFQKQVKLNKYLYIPIIITKNHYQLNLFNGDLGILEYNVTKNKIFDGKAYFIVENNIKQFPIYSISSYEFAYAISIHKSQGSEFDSTIIIIPDISQNVGKELLYTAITRAKKSIHLVSSKEFLIKIINKSNLKKSGFLNRLI